MNKALVLLSGGIDSLICLALAINKHGKENVKTVSIFYGQTNDKELIHSKQIAEYYNVSYEVLDISNIFKGSNCSLIKASNNDIPHESYEEQVKTLEENEDVKTNVPFRNGIMLSCASAYAIMNKLNLIYYGIHKEYGIAKSLYPDCSYEFNESMNLSIYIGSGKRVQIYAPLVDMTKKEIIAFGKDLNVDYSLTWTCYENNEHACGKCTACKDRLRGFKENNLIDPIKYEV